MHQGSKRDMNHVDNQYDPEQDDVVGVEEELDIDLRQGKQMKHGLNLTMNSFNRYNAEVDSIAKQYNRPTWLPKSDVT
jgi:hypothetical protein